MRRVVTHALLFSAFIVAANAFGHPMPTYADEGSDPIASVTVGSASIEMMDRRPTVVVRVSCAVDLSFVRVRAVLTQRAQATGSGSAARNLPSASSFQTREFACVANETVDVAVVFGPQEGSFTPGRAEISGLVGSFVPSALRTIPATALTLRPGTPLLD